MKKFVFTLLLFSFTTITTAGQAIKIPAVSPQQTVKMSMGEDEISVDYSRIKLRGRKFFGDGSAYMFPYGKIWRTGANAGSKITFSRDVIIGERVLSKGTYVLLSWPGKKQWDISFYKDLAIGGSVDQYTPEKEALKVRLTPQELEKTVETFTITFSRSGSNTGIIHLAMENTLLQIPFTLKAGNTPENTLMTSTQVLGIDEVSLAWASHPQTVKLQEEFYVGNITVAEETEIAGEPVPADKYNFFLDMTANKVRFSGSKGKEFKITPLKTGEDKDFNYRINNLGVNFSHLPEDKKTVLLKIDAASNSYIIPVTCEFDNKVMKSIEAASQSPSFNAHYNAATYYLENGKNLDQALVWINRAITASPKGFWIVYQKAKIHYARGEYAQAITSAEQSRQLSEDQKNTDWVKLNDQLIADAQTKLANKDAVIITAPTHKITPTPQTGPVATAETTPATNARFALIIGVKSYTGTSPLTNTVNDANDMARALKKIGFNVTELIDPKTKRDIQEAVRKYYSTLRENKGAVGLVFYSGHGLQIDGSNYLVPASASLEIKADVEDQCVNMNYIMQAIEEAKNPLNIFILDACRNNPFRGFDRSGEKGLTLVSAPAGSYIVYATKPGSVASDGTGRNGLFTSSLLKYMNTPNMNIEQVFKNVAREVISQSNNAQRPWIASDYIGDFYFLK